MQRRRLTRIKLAAGASGAPSSRGIRSNGQTAILRRTFIGMLAASSALAALAQPLVLVTEEEAAAARSAGAMLTPRSVPQPGAPRIHLVAPDISRPIAAPTPIEVRFVVEPPAQLKPESFRVFYGAFRIDVTQRLLGSAQVTRDGISVKEAAIPSGRHQLLLSITDSMGRETLHLVSFTVQ
jgi:hypothetical protein